MRISELTKFLFFFKKSIFLADFLYALITGAVHTPLSLWCRTSQNFEKSYFSKFPKKSSNCTVFEILAIFEHFFNYFFQPLKSYFWLFALKINSFIPELSENNFSFLKFSLKVIFLQPPKSVHFRSIWPSSGSSSHTRKKIFSEKFKGPITG